MTDALDLDAVGQAELVRTGEMSPAELVDAAIARIEERNPELNAVIHPRFEAARAEAAGELPDGPFGPLVPKRRASCPTGRSEVCRSWSRTPLPPWPASPLTPAWRS